MLYKKYEVKHFGFCDWEFTLQKERVLEICKEMINRKLKMTWTCNARFTDIDEELLKEMSKAGCIEIKFGFESGSKEIIRISKKGINLDKVPEIIKLCKKYKIKPFLYGIIAMPGETMKTLKESISYSAKHGTGKGGGKIVIPYPGTELHAMAEKEFGKTITWDDLPKIAGHVGTQTFHLHAITKYYL